MSGPLNNDQWSALFWFVLGLLVCIASVRYGLGTLRGPATGFMPFLAGSAICLFSLIGFTHSTYKRKKGVVWKSPLDGIMWMRALLCVLTLFVYAIFLEPLGFFLSTCLFVGFLMCIGQQHRWPVAILSGLVAAASAYLVFVVLLKVQFPRGPLGF